MAQIDECRTCVFWRGLEGIDSSYGRCRRYPPTTVLQFSGGGDWIKISTKQGNPETFGAAWCGEFKKLET
mgnify:CR=1 FL=1